MHKTEKIIVAITIILIIEFIAESSFRFIQEQVSYKILWARRQQSSILILKLIKREVKTCFAKITVMMCCVDV